MRVLADEWGMTHDNMDMFGGGQIPFHGGKGIEWVVEQFIGNKWFYGGSVLILSSY